MPKKKKPKSEPLPFDDAWAAIEKVEQKIAELEFRAAAMANIDDTAVEDAIAQKQMASQIEEELAALKKESTQLQSKSKLPKLVVGEPKKQLPAVRSKKTKNLPKRLDD